MNTYCIQYMTGLHTNYMLFFAMSAQAAVDYFRSKHAERIVAVFLLDKTEDWK